MTVTATCGCVLTEEEGMGETFYVKDSDRHGNCISYKTICKKCQAFYWIADLMLPTQEDQDKWINQ